LDYANNHWSTWRKPGSFAFNEYGDSLTPIIARLPRSRGFLAGWTMGSGMCAELDATVWETAEEAAQAAYDFAESAAERQADFEAEEAARLDAEEAEAEAELDAEEAWDGIPYGAELTAS
jgi:hypothetical protein